MLETLEKIASDDTGEELRRVLFSAALHILGLVIVANLAFIWAAASVSALAELDGSPIVILDGSYSLYWVPIWAVLITIWIVATLHLGSLQWEPFWVIAPIMVGAYVLEAPLVMKLTNWHVQSEMTSQRGQYVRCLRLRHVQHRPNIIGAFLLVWSNQYSSNNDFVFTPTQAQCAQLKQALGGKSALKRNVFPERVWPRSLEYRRSLDPYQERDAPTGFDRMRRIYNEPGSAPR